MIHFLCPYCRKSHKARDLDSGKKCRCKSCNLLIDIPGKLQHEPTVQAPLDSVETLNDLSRDENCTSEEDSQDENDAYVYHRKPRYLLLGLVTVCIILMSSIAWLFWSNPNLKERIVHSLEFHPRIIKQKNAFVMKAFDAYSLMRNEISNAQTYICEPESTEKKRGDKVYAMRDETSYRDWRKFSGANDKYGLKELLDNDKAVLITPQTECLVLSAKFEYLSHRIEVRVIEGPFEGKVFFINSDFICTK
jgi:hypothetical protein